MEDVRQFLVIDERTENREQYGTFWKRFMQQYVYSLFFIVMITINVPFL